MTDLLTCWAIVVHIYIVITKLASRNNKRLLSMFGSGSAWVNAVPNKKLILNCEGFIELLGYSRTHIDSRNKAGKQCWGSKYIELRSGSRILAQFGSRSGSGAWVKNQVWGELEMILEWNYFSLKTVYCRFIA